MLLASCPGHFPAGYVHFGFKTHWLKSEKVPTTVSKLASTVANVEFSDHWYWESDRLILSWFDTKVSVLRSQSKHHSFPVVHCPI